MEILLAILLICWGVITVVLVALLGYRAILSSREDDQIFINTAEQQQYREQQAVLAKMARLTVPIITLAIISAVLLLASAGVWVYRGWTLS